MNNKYQREIKPGVFVDVYDVLKAWDVRNPALQHLIKKALAVGQRGHKDATEDLRDIVDSAVRARELDRTDLKLVETAPECRHVWWVELHCGIPTGKYVCRKCGRGYDPSY